MRMFRMFYAAEVCGITGLFNVLTSLSARRRSMADLSRG
jgi:hypothetical protein